jgi:hypothetical protein
MTQTAPTVPTAPQGTPAILIKIVAAVLGVAGPLFAWVDPGNHLPHGAIQACVILGFLVVAAAIFLTHVVLAAVHEYGWSMNAVTHIDTQAEAEMKTLWPELKQTYEAAKPALDQIPQAASIIDRVGELEHQLAERASTPAMADIVAAVRADLGFAPKTDGTPADPAAGAGQVS